MQNRCIVFAGFLKHGVVWEQDLVKKTVDKETGETSYQYYHKALEAKIHLGAGLLLSIATEFIENEKEDVSKQDCELNAGFGNTERLVKDEKRI